MDREGPPQGVYRPRWSKASPLWKCLAKHFVGFVEGYADRHKPGHGFLRPVIVDVVDKFPDCGDLSKGFARVYCDDCRDEYQQVRNG